MLGDGPYGLSCVARPDNEVQCTVKIIKIIPSARTTEEVYSTADTFGAFFILTGMGTSDRSDEHFYEAVPSTACRLQCRHQAIVSRCETRFVHCGKGKFNGK